MTKIKREIIRVPCENCLGTGRQYYDRVKKACHVCKGTGEVDKVVNRLEPEGAR